MSVMEIGLIGLAKSGKTTLFNALTRGKAETAPYASGSLTPNIGVAKVPDARLAGLEAIFHPRKTIPAEVKYVDVAVPPKAQAGGKGWSAPYLAYLSRADALVAVVRAFADERIPHPEASIDPHRDLVAIELELAFSDLAIQERRLEKVATSLKSARPAEREPYIKEQALLGRIKEALEKEVPLREQALSPEEAGIIEGYQFLTAKPLLALFNLDEADAARAATLEEEWQRRYQRPQFGVLALCARLEMELSQLPEEEARDFRASLGVGEAGLDRLVHLSYQLLGLISFFTVVSGEVRAWSIRRGTTALKAAGKIHSDMERGFIRAEVMGYQDLMKCGGLAEARRQGLLRAEGKGYEVKDGDVITFLFNI